MLNCAPALALLAKRCETDERDALNRQFGKGTLEMNDIRLGRLQPLAPDPLLSITAAYRADDRAGKIDLGVGVFKDEAGATPIMRSIANAHDQFSTLEKTKAYIGPKGWPGFAAAGAALIAGDEASPALLERIVTTPTPGGCGALRLAGDLLRQLRPTAKVWLSDPTWPNHAPIFSACGFEIAKYPYFSIDEGLKEGAMLAALEQATPGDIVVLHACCHNPTGEDLTEAAWAAVTRICVERNLLPLIDSAYHGLGDGLEQDLAGLHSVLNAVPEAFVCYSFSKNMGLYRERVGLLAFLGETHDEAKAVDSHILAAARQNYSMPPTYGEALAFLTLDDKTLRADWRVELSSMRERIKMLRAGAVDALGVHFGDNRFNYLNRQKGMFSMLPLSADQIARAREEHAVYIAPGGRINICGLPQDRLDEFASAIAAVSG